MSEALATPAPAVSTGARIVRGAAVALAFNIFSNLFLFIGQLIIPRALSHEEYAQFTVSISFVAIMSLLADLGMTSMFTRTFTEAEEEVERGLPDRRGTLIGSALALRAGLAVLVAVLVLVIAPLIYPQSIVSNIVIVLPTVFISSRLLIVRAVGESILKSRGKFHIVTAFMLVDAIAFASAIAIGATGTLTVSLVLWIYTLSNIPGFIFLAMFVLRWCHAERIRLHVERRAMFNFLRAAIPLSLAIGFLTVHNEIDKQMLYWLSTPYEVSSFGALVRLLAAVIPIPMVLGYIAAPELTRLLMRGNIAKSQQLTDLVLRILLVASGAIAVFLIPASTEVATLFLGSKYQGSGYLLAFMGWMVIPVFISTFLSEMSIASGHFWPFAAYTATIMLAVIIGDILLIPMYGALGAMIAKLTAVTIGCAVLLWFLHTSEFLRLREFLFVAGKVTAAIGIAICIGNFIPPNALSSWISAAIMLAMFLAGIHFFKVLSIADVWGLILRFRSTPLS